MKTNLFSKKLAIILIAFVMIFSMTGCDWLNNKTNDYQKPVSADSTKTVADNTEETDRVIQQPTKNGQQIKKELLDQWMFPENYSEKDFFVLDGDNKQNFINVWDLAREFEYIEPQITRGQKLYIRPWDRRIIGFDKKFPGYVYYRDAKKWEVESAEAMAECLEKINLQRDRDINFYFTEDFFNDIMPKQYKKYLKNSRASRLGR